MALLMVVLMAISLVMSAAIPEAFGERGLAFAAAYVLLQLVRSSFIVVAFRKGERMRRPCAQLLAWSAFAPRRPYVGLRDVFARASGGCRC